jgi:DNA repair exonuclease SbcCD ATPase subunit
MNNVQRALKEPLKDYPDDKGESVQILEKNKYRSLEAFLEEDLSGLHTLGEALEHASLDKPADSAELAKINEHYSASKKRFDFLTKTFGELTKKKEDQPQDHEEDSKQIEEIREELWGTKSERWKNTFRITKKLRPWVRQKRHWLQPIILLLYIPF